MKLNDFHPTLAFAQNVLALDELYTTLETSFCKLELPEDVKATGIQINNPGDISESMLGKVQISIHKKRIRLRYEHVWLAPKDKEKQLGGRVKFMLIDEENKATESLFELLFDDLGNVQLNQEKKWLHSINKQGHDSQHTILLIVLQLIEAAQGHLDPVDC